MNTPDLTVNAADIPTLTTHSDLVFVRELYCKAVTGIDAWKRPQHQPLLISIWLHTDISKSGNTDHLSYSLNYDVISRNVTKMIESSTFKSLEEVASRVAYTVLADRDTNGGQWTTVHIKKPRALLRAECSEIVISRIKEEVTQKKGKTTSSTFQLVPAKGSQDVVKIHKLQLVTVIGVNTIERMHKQNVTIDLVLYRKKRSDPTPINTYDPHYDFRDIVDAVTNHVEDSRYKTIEAFATSIAKIVTGYGVDKVTVRAEKPSAITFAEAAGVEITRTKEFFELERVEEAQREAAAEEEKGNAGKDTVPLFPTSGGSSDSVHRAYVAFGSNQGDCVQNIRNSIDELQSHGIKVLATSSIHLSDPMFVQNQDKFHNGVFYVETTLAPLDLLDKCKEIESALKRTKLFDNGPRTIDLDILLYDDDLVMDSPRLKIPHIGMLSRSFVLRPLVELVPSDLVHPLTAETFKAHLNQIPDTSDVQKSSDTFTLIPMANGSRPPLVFDLVGHTLPTAIMAILNVTPDSFSDPGRFFKDQEVLVSTALEFVKQGATILDIGGMSTNPSSTDPGEQEELARVVPAVKALRSCKDLDSILISVDTYRANVARAALEAGADIINDISAGQLDANMFAVAKEFGAPIILNHTRGTPQTMNSLAKYDGEEGDPDLAVVDAVAKELLAQVDLATKEGIPRWQLILDPGLGFAKNLHHNLAVCRHFDKLVKSPGLAGMPWLVGPSRKKFIGTITGKPVAAERVLGTAAVITNLISQGADIIRVHDVAEMADVVKMADAIYRRVLPTNN